MVLIGLFLMAAAPAQAGLVSQWKANGNALDSTGTNNGTLVGGVTYAPGVEGQAFHFDGSNYFQAGTAGMPTGNADRTMYVRFNITSADTIEQFLAGYGVYGTWAEAYVLGVTRGMLFFSQWGDVVYNGSVSLGAWHSAAVTNVGNFATVYLDGVEIASGSIFINTADSSNFYLGRIPGYEFGYMRQLNGFIDEARVYNRALSSDEVRALDTIVPDAAVPEPSSFVMLGLGAMGLIGVAARARGSKRLNAA